MKGFIRTFETIAVPLIFTLISAFGESESAATPNRICQGAENNIGPHSIMATGEGLCLACPFQKLDAYFSPERFFIRAVSCERGRCDFSITPFLLRRGSFVQSIPEFGKVSPEDGHFVRLDRELLTERFSSSSEGIRQDFIVLGRPAGRGAVTLFLKIEGAEVSDCNGSVSITIPLNRKFVYGRLKVTDMLGNILTASMEAIEKNTLKITFRDEHAVYPVTIDPTLTDADWEVVNSAGIAGMDGPVQAIACVNKNIYIGGIFSAAGTALVNNIARWDGTTLSALGSGVNGHVDALVGDRKGNLYVGGLFSSAGGIAVTNIAKWDGAGWSTLGTGLKGQVNALAFDSSGNLYAGGNFTSIGPDSIKYIAKWDGSAWSSLGQGMDTSVDAISIGRNDMLYAAGMFTQAGGLRANYIARWNGTRWDSLGSGLNGEVLSLACDTGGNVYAGGAFNPPGSMIMRHLAKWNGVQWDTVGALSTSMVPAMVFDDSGKLYCVNNNIFSRITILKWDGVKWTDVGSTNYGISSLVFDDKKNLIAGGTFTKISAHSALHIAKWNGTDWSALVSGMTEGILALASDSSGIVYAGGSFTSVNGTAANYVAKWDGVNWSPLGSGLDATVYALACDRKCDLYAGGWFTRAGGIRAKHVAKWDGFKWDSLGSGIGDSVCALAFDTGGTLFGIGYANTISPYTPRIYIWDGNNWNINIGLFQGLHGLVRCIAFNQRNYFYAGGYFYLGSYGNAVPADRIAGWNGSWNQLGQGMSIAGYASAIVFDSIGSMYVGGYYDHFYELAANSITANGKAIGSGTNGAVNALAVWHSTLYVGGNFSIAGGKLSPYLAKVNLRGSNAGAVSGRGNGMMSNRLRYRFANNKLRVSSLTQQDQISLFTLSGVCVREAVGCSEIALNDIAPQLLFVRVSRAGKTVSTGIVAVRLGILNRK